MKTKIVTLAALLIIRLGITNATYAATAKKEGVTVLTNITAINKIEVYGNVELYISDGESNLVKVYNHYYNENALVQNKNGVLRITSYTAEKLVVWVTSNELTSIAAYDNAEVKSFGNLSKIEFNVDLHNNASAKLNIDAFSASVIVNDEAKVDLSGTVNEYNLKYSKAENVNQANLAVTHTSKTCTTLAAVAKVNTEQLADL